MPILKNAKKAMRSSERKASVNNRVRSQMKTALVKARTTATKETVSSAFSVVDTALKQNLIHRNKAARLKQQLSKLTAPKK
jgi:small subunit ribosomal protein S20